MAKQEEKDIDIAETISKTEDFVSNNKNMLGIVLGGIVLVVGGYLGYTKLIQGPNEKNAAQQAFVAEENFRSDSLDLALNGDGNYPGFLEIIENYGATKTGNLARYYAGMAYLKKGEFDNAITHLKKYDGDDEITGSLALGGIGDAYMELGNTSEAISYYKKAYKNTTNQFTTPRFMMKTGLAFEISGDAKKASEIYEKIRTDWPESSEGREIEKYIARANALAGGN